MIDDLKIKDLKELINLFSSKEDKTIYNGEEIRIVILQRAWCVVGKFYQVGHACEIRNGFVIRRWGTSEGLGELALKGKLSDTILDKLPPSIKFHELTIIASLVCVKEKWENICH